MVSPQNVMATSKLLELVNVALFGRRILVNVIKLGSWDEIILDYQGGPWIQWQDPISILIILKKKRHMKEKAMWWWRQRLEVCGHKPKMSRNAWSHQKPEESRKNSSPELLEGAQLCQLMPWFWTSVFQNCEIINFHCFVSPSLW